jgi:glucose/arabinose dehydrogenase
MHHHRHLIVKYFMHIVIAVTAITIARAQDVQPGTTPWTPMITGGLVPVSIAVPPKYSSVGLDAVRNRINLPDGWTANVYAAGSALRKLRFLSFGPDSVLYGANMNGGNILAMPDRDRDGVADTIYVAASGFVDGHDVRFWGDTMYVSHRDGIVKLLDLNRDGVFETRTVLVDRTKLSNQTGGHITRTLVIDTLRRKMYCALGSVGNADREPTRALIEEFELDGTGRRFYATGIRNAVGMTLHPRTGRLWANNNGSDLQGNDVPGEWVDLIRDGGFYGYPIAWHHQRYFDFGHQDYKDLLPITVDDSARVRSMLPPAAIVTAHSAPMALQFMPMNVAPRWRHGALMVLRGSWNRTPASGSKVVFLSFDDDNDTVANAVHDFCTGFLTDSVNKVRWARPVGLEIGSDGSVYLTSDDIKNFVLKLTPPTTSSVEDHGALRDAIRVVPQPASDIVHIAWQGATKDVNVQTVDASGRVVDVRTAQADAIVQGIAIDTRGLASGTYVARLMQGDRTVHVPFVVRH